MYYLPVIVFTNSVCVAYIYLSTIFFSPIPLPTILLFPIPTRLHQHQYIDWSEDHCPINADAIVDLIGVLQKAQLQLGGGPIVVRDRSAIHLSVHVSNSVCPF